MAPVVIGINYKSAPVAIREQLAFPNEHLPQALHSFTEKVGAREAVILSTCNRSEIYCSLSDSDTERPLVWLLQYHQLNVSKFRSYLFCYQQEQAVRHLFQVACGLDSMVLGEPQILGQLKDAYEIATQSGTTNKQLHKLFQRAFAVAKQVRTDTAIGSSPISVAYSAVRLAQQIFVDLPGQTALLIGAGDTIELVARHFMQQGIKRLIIANRSLDRAQLLATEFGGYALALRDIPRHLAEVDIIVASTASPEPVLTQEQVSVALQQRRHRPMLIIDIAVPRDVEATVAELEDVYLYTVDDLQAIIQEGIASRRLAAAQAEGMIETEVQHFMTWLRSLESLSIMQSLRQQAEQIRREALQRAELQLARGDKPEVVLEQFSQALVNKLMHAPTVRLKEASAAEQSELLRIAQELFNL